MPSLSLVFELAFLPMLACLLRCPSLHSGLCIGGPCSKQFFSVELNELVFSTYYIGELLEFVHCAIRALAFSTFFAALFAVSAACACHHSSWLLQQWCLTGNIYQPNCDSHSHVRGRDVQPRIQRKITALRLLLI
jgi:hypothetical protein